MSLTSLLLATTMSLTQNFQGDLYFGKIWGVQTAYLVEKDKCTLVDLDHDKPKLIIDLNCDGRMDYVNSLPRSSFELFIAEDYDQLLKKAQEFVKK